VKVEVQFRNPFQEEFFFAKNRNTCFSGGFNNGKTYAGCLKAFTLLSSFPNYRMVIARESLTDLKRTTLVTFQKICPAEFIETFDRQSGVMTFKNRSVAYWLHLDAFRGDDSALRGLEINSALVDQAEEIDESIYLILDSRIGRWEKAEVPPPLLTPDWPKTPLGNPKAPTYNMLLCNPDSQFHFIYRRYHPDSVEKLPNHLMVQSPTDVSLGDAETMEEMKGRDPEWVKRFFLGEWGISEAQIHYVPSESIIEATPELIERIQSRGNLMRGMDHGDSAPTSCLWGAAIDGTYIFYREYYMPNQPISTHRREITGLSGDEQYSLNVADPSIFRKSSQKDGAFWTVADEYLTRDIDAPSIAWQPADNNEMSTRNRINELFQFSKFVKHPITGNSPAPQLYFIKKTEAYPEGCFHAIKETQSQRRKKLGDENGKSIYSDDREPSISDHAYDTLRYIIAMHGRPKMKERPKIKPRTFAWYKHLVTRNQRMVSAST